MTILNDLYLSAYTVYLCFITEFIYAGILVKAVLWPLRDNITKALSDQDKFEAEKLKSSMTLALSKPLLELGKGEFTGSLNLVLGIYWVLKLGNGNIRCT